MQDWRTFLDTLVRHWREEAPTFDAEALRRAVLALPSPQDAVEAVINLEEAKQDVRPDGSYTVDFESARHEPAEQWLASHLPASLPILLLALRHPDHQAQMRVEGILYEAPTMEALPALLSALEFQPPNHYAHRSHLVPTDALKQLGKPSGEAAQVLIRALDHDDFRVADEAAVVLAEFATDDVLFDALWARRHRAGREDTYAWALMRAAEVRKDPLMRPFLQSMLRGDRFDSAGYHERIREALAGLPKATKHRPAAKKKKAAPKKKLVAKKKSAKKISRARK